jgi:hypothetical protein
LSSNDQRASRPPETFESTQDQGESRLGLASLAAWATPSPTFPPPRNEASLLCGGFSSFS